MIKHIKIFFSSFLLLSPAVIFAQDVQTSYHPSSILIIIDWYKQWAPILPFLFNLFFIYKLFRYTQYKVNNVEDKRIKTKKHLIIIAILFILSVIGWATISILTQTFDKPVIYLYPKTTEEVKVSLDYQGNIIANYPEFDSSEGWTVTATPKGDLTGSDGKEYSYLFWEGKPYVNTNFDLSTGFIVKGKDTISFLQNILPKIGLTPKEYNEFIVYWYPIMKNNPYNLIHFAGTEYTDVAKLNISPKPDSTLRVFMVVKPLNKQMNIKTQNIEPFRRSGFTVVEWGGTIIN